MCVCVCVCVCAAVVKSRTVSDGVKYVESDDHKSTATLVNLVNVLCLSFLCQLLD